MRQSINLREHLSILCDQIKYIFYNTHNETKFQGEKVWMQVLFIITQVSEIAPSFHFNDVPIQFSSHYLTQLARKQGSINWDRRAVEAMGKSFPPTLHNLP